MAPDFLNLDAATSFTQNSLHYHTDLFFVLRLAPDDDIGIRLCGPR